MKRNISIALILCAFTSLFAQTDFEKGSYTDNTGNQTDGYIKNVDWKDNPVSFEFSKTSDGENSISKTIQQVQSFEITGVSLYERHRVLIDRSSQEVKYLGYKRNPEMSQETLFLKVMLDGENKLFRYRDNNLLKLYFKKGTDPISALVYKRYLSTSQNIAENNFYKQQLTNSFKCEGGNLPSLSNLNYTTPDLLNFFKKYNTCSGIAVEEIDQRKSKASFQVTAVAGLNANSYFVDPPSRAPLDFGSSTTPVFGIELEYILPFYNNKWSILLDTRYASFSGEVVIPGTSIFSIPQPSQKVSLDYYSIDMSPGVRHYIFLNDHSKIFLNLSFALELTSDSTIDYERSSDLSAGIGAGTIGIGVGYTYKDIRVEARYNGTKNHFGRSFGTGVSEYKSFMFTFGYSFVKF
tara:strand:+ start:10007 stop:11230 length:1224 start_codon:yes stop_codon:yes gene_type:complete